MTTNIKIIEKEGKNFRGVHSISKAVEFFNLAQTVLHLAAGDIFFHNVHFTILLTAINRGHRGTRKFKRTELEQVPLFCAGLEQQKNFLQYSFKGRAEDESAWQTLHKTRFEEAEYMEMMKVSRDYYGRIAKGELSLKDIKPGKLRDYFSGDLNPIQKAEKSIFEQTYDGGKPCFDISQDSYLSVPLIGFAEFDGVAHIIFRKEGEEWVNNHTISLIIKRFQQEYENLYFTWATVDEQREKLRSIRKLFSDEILDEDYYESVNKNPILKEIGCLDRYRKYSSYFNFRLNEADSIPNLLYHQYLRQAITAILIDSYAHNISAHSLTALSWWFRLRSIFRDNVKREEKKRSAELWSAIDHYLEDPGKLANRLLFKNLKEDLFEIKNLRETLEAKFGLEVGVDGNGLITSSSHLSRELHPFLKFLMEKGAYWSGITRDANVGGKINSFFSILWYDFINNPLFLGTIAKTEDIKSIKINITIYEPDKGHDAKSLVHTLQIKTEGILAVIDLDKPRTKEDPEDEKDAALASRSIFMEPGSAFRELRNLLNKIKVYFPGGVVGKHAFFTMLENEIRNIKHYHGRDLENLQKEGLTMNISVQPCSLPGSDREELYRIGIWLKVPTLLQKPSDRHLVVKKWETLYNEITEPATHSPKLGGTYQDKICAAMLMNSQFSSVQNGFKSENRDDSFDTEREIAFYPWTTPACCLVEKQNSDTHTDFGLTARNYESFSGQVPAEFSGNGYLKKYLHLWRFEDLLHLPEGEINRNENCSRFRFVFAPKEKVMSLRKDNGVVRIITTDPTSDLIEDVYSQWMEIWNEGYPSVLYLEENDNPHTLLALDNGKFKVYFPDDFDSQSPNPDAVRLKKIATSPENARECLLYFAHKEGTEQIIKQPDLLRFRNHGSMRTHFWAGLEGYNPFQTVVKTHPDRLIEFFETMTSRICIFDNRIWQRIRKDIEDSKDVNGDFSKRLDFYRNKLKLVVYGESPTNTKGGKTWLQEWESELEDFIPTCQFLVMHLSLIERILETKYINEENYKGNIGLFIQKELMPYVQKDGRIRDNFFLVITTGRGRSEWLASLNQEMYLDYNRFTIFRPVESLISAVDFSLSMKDDIDLKFRLSKVLFGS